MEEVTGYAVIDADGLILGRLASAVAKRLLCGERIVVVNSEKAIISGSKNSIIGSYKEKLRIRTLINPAKGPFHARGPDRILRRTVRGMLPWDTTRGKKAFERLSTFIGVPPELKKTKFESLPSAKVERLKGRFVRLAEISTQMGWRQLQQ